MVRREVWRSASGEVEVTMPSPIIRRWKVRYCGRTFASGWALDLSDAWPLLDAMIELAVEIEEAAEITGEVPEAAAAIWSLVRTVQRAQENPEAFTRG